MYTLTMINRNGYIIKRDGRSIKELQSFAAYYPLSVFFTWIYDKRNNEIVRQNIWSDKWQKCNNESFVPYYQI